MSRSPREGRAGVRHTPKRSNLIGHSWGAPSVLQSISVLGTQPKSGAGRGLVPPILNLVVSIKGSTAFVVGVLTLIPIHGAPPRWGIHSYP